MGIHFPVFTAFVCISYCCKYYCLTPCEISIIMLTVSNPLTFCFSDLTQLLVPWPSVVAKVTHRSKSVRNLVVYSHRQTSVVATCWWVSINSWRQSWPLAGESLSTVDVSRGHLLVSLSTADVSRGHLLVSLYQQLTSVIVAARYQDKEIFQCWVTAQMVSLISCPCANCMYEHWMFGMWRHCSLCYRWR